MLLQHILAWAFIVVLAALLIRLNIAGYKEGKRRVNLPLSEQESLRRDDADWQQKYGF